MNSLFGGSFKVVFEDPYKAFIGSRPSPPCKGGGASPYLKGGAGGEGGASEYFIRAFKTTSKLSLYSRVRCVQAL